MNVDSPRDRWSAAPTLVKMRSNTDISAFEAGTNEPACARRTAVATWRRYVDLPPMFGPVTTRIRFSGERSQSFGMKGSSRRTASTMGCRASVRQSRGRVVSRGRTQRPDSAISAKLAATSMAAAADATAATRDAAPPSSARSAP
jgi:hypothetical protein